MKSNVANRPPWSCEAQSQMGFTLVELLVVITIIVVLLALLSSALDRAIYRAELLRCAANLDGIATGVQTYAVDFKRSYPYRPIQRGLGGNPVRISAPGAANDTRPQLRNYMSMNGHLLCPFIPVKVDIDGSASDTQVYSSYNLFFGVQYKDELGATHPGMLRLGDKLEWEGERYGTLATDFDVIQKDLSVAYTSHPDWEGAARPKIRRACSWAATSPRFLVGFIPASGAHPSTAST